MAHRRACVVDVLELLRMSGYQLVSPPLLEYAESLLINRQCRHGSAHFQAGRSIERAYLGFARRHHTASGAYRCASAQSQGVTRLCYAGSVVHTQPAGLMRTREPLQIGAELLRAWRYRE